MWADALVESKQSRCWATALGREGRPCCSQFPSARAGAGGRAQVGEAGQGWEWPGPGGLEEGNWDGGREMCGQKLRTGSNCKMLT